jgi:hypothetical protein
LTLLPIRKVPGSVLGLVIRADYLDTFVISLSIYIFWDIILKHFSIWLYIKYEFKKAPLYKVRTDLTTCLNT